MDYAQFSKRFSTISAINILPFYPESKAINWNGLDENIEFLIRHGVEVVVPNGNTGEFYALGIEEAKQVTKRVTEIVDRRATVVAGVGYSVETAIELGLAAQEAGADCVMIHQPIHPYITEDGAVEYFRKIIDALDIPSIIYFKDPNLSDNVIKRLAPLKKLVGVKYSVNDVQRVTKLIRDVPKEYHIAWICGTAEKWAPFYFLSGASGFTSGLVNVFPKKSFMLLDAMKQVDQERVWKIWEDILPFEDLRGMHNNGNNVVVIKEAMEQLGLTAGVTREPVEPLTAADKALLQELLNKWKVLQ